MQVDSEIDCKEARSTRWPDAREVPNKTCSNLGYLAAQWAQTLLQ